MNASFRNKVRLSTALAFSATLGMAATTLLTPSVVSAQAAHVDNLEYSEVTAVEGNYIDVAPKDNNTQGLIWSKDKPSTYYGGKKDGLRDSDYLNPATGEVVLSGFSPSWGDGETEMEITRYVYATKGQQSSAVPITVKLKKASEGSPKLKYPKNIFPDYGRITSFSTAKSLSVESIMGEEINPVAEGFTFSIDRESALYKPFMKDFSIDADTGALIVNRPDFGNYLPSTEMTHWDISVPVVATPKDGGDVHKLIADVGVGLLVRDAFNPRVYVADVKPGESVTRELFYYHSNNRADEPQQAKGRFSWLAGNLEESVLVQELIEIGEGSEFEPVITAPKGLPDWITWDDEKKVATISPTEDVKPGKYVYNIGFDIPLDRDMTSSWLDEAQEFVEKNKEAYPYLSESDFSIEGYKNVPIVVNVLGDNEEVPDDEERLPDSDDTDQNTAVNSSGKDGQSSTKPKESESASQISKTDPVVSPVQRNSDSAVQDSNSTPPTVRQVLANTGANVITLVSLGLLAVLAGVAFLLYQRRSTS